MTGIDPRTVKRTAGFSALFSLPLALCLVTGYQLETTDHVTPGLTGVAFFILLGAALTALTALSLSFTPKRRDTSSGMIAGSAEAGTPVSGPVPGFLKTWACISIPNLIVLLGVYPGFFVYDAQDELTEVISRKFTTHHPLFHVLAMGGTATGVHKITGSWNKGIFVYLLLQMLFITAVYTYVLLRLKKSGLSAPLQIIFTLWYAVFPTVVMYTNCSTKDGLFSAFLTLLVLELACPSEGTAHYILTGVYSTFMMLLRNNAFHALLLFTLILAAMRIAAVLRKREKKPGEMKLITALIFAIGAYIILNNGLIMLTHASHNEHQESITVAIQALGRTWHYHGDSFSPEDEETLRSYLSDEGLRGYELRNADFIKSTFNNSRYESDSASFWKLFLKMGRKHPATYLNSWLLTSYGEWYPFFVNNIYKDHTVFTFTYTESSYFGYETEQPGERSPIIPGIDQLYRWLSLDDDIQRIPVISLLFAPAFYFWLYLYFAIRRLHQKRGSEILSLVPLFLLWLTYLAGPGSLVRYSLPFFTALPVLSYLILRRENIR